MNEILKPIYSLYKQLTYNSASGSRVRFSRTGADPGMGAAGCQGRGSSERGGWSSKGDSLCQISMLRNNNVALWNLGKAKFKKKDHVEL